MADSSRLTNRRYDILERALPPSVGRRDLARAIGNTTFAGDPTNNVTPAFIGELCHDTTNAALYWASTAASSGWKKLTP